jgi:hypothetical protein
MADVAADHLIEALRLSSFVIMRGPPAPNHAGPGQISHKDSMWGAVSELMT